MNARRLSLVFLVVGTAGCAGRCGARGGLPPQPLPMVKGADGQLYHMVDRGSYKAFYDSGGKLHRLEYDKNGDGLPDQIAHHGGSKTPRTIEVDEDFDGLSDRWEDYDSTGALVKVGVSRRGRRVDLWTVPGPDGQPLRKLYDDDDDGKVERTEFLEGGRVARVEVDADRDGRPDRWQEWRQGRLTSETLDTNGDGAPDRRIRYGERGNVVGLEPLAR